MIQNFFRLLALALAIALLLSASFAHATEVDQGDELFLFHLGYFFPSFDTKMRIEDGDALTARGDKLNLEKDLGFDHTETTIWGDVAWRISERNRLSLGYFRFHRAADKVISKEIEIGDETYPLGAELHTVLDIIVIPIAYSYSFIKDSTMEFSGTFGLQWSTLKFKANGSASSGNRDADAEARADAVAPLPLVGLGFNYNFSPEWSVGGSLGAFIYKIGAANMTFQGTILSATVNADWWFSNYVGVGAAVNWFSFDITVKDRNWDGALNYQYIGPQVYLVGRF
jgi:hypothetical protein